VKSEMGWDCVICCYIIVDLQERILPSVKSWVPNLFMAEGHTHYFGLVLRATGGKIASGIPNHLN